MKMAVSGRGTATTTSPPTASGERLGNAEPVAWQHERHAGRCLDLYIGHATNGIRFTELERRHLKRIHYGEPDQTMAEEVAIA
jgi:hypothetical protein